jgi:hypothetical protein
MSVMPAETLVALQREAEAPLFVINLCASTTPVALTPPSTPELKRFNFFVTRQREDGRERFRLHMGYFATQEEAEVVLSAVRDVYPAAWSGPAPTNRASGARSRAAAVAAAPAPVAPAIAAPTVPAASFAPPARLVAPPVAQVVAQVVAQPVVEPPARPAPVAASPEAAALAAPAAPVAVPVAAAPVAKPARPPAAAKQVVPARTAPAATIAPPAAKEAEAAKAAAGAATAAAPEETLDAMSNVREVLAQLADDPPRGAEKLRKPARVAAVAEARPAPVAAAVKPAAAVVKPAPAQPAAPRPAAPKPAEVVPPATKPAEAVVPSAKPPEPVLSAAQTLAVLEARAPFAEPGREAAADIRVITPEDTQTLRDISLDAQNAAAPAYAVQLCWSVTPIDAESLPHLAIFDAYTLYNVEGNRQGRRWYGLRLGFFTDPDGARQVAHYVRSDYATVAVVPVTTRERDRASGKAAAEPSASGNYAAPLRRSDTVPAQPQKLEAPRSDVFTGFELLQDDRPVAPKRDVDEVAKVPGNPPTLKPAVRPANGVAGAVGAKPAARPAGKRAVARKPRPVMPGAAQPLEETLEILGASTLTLDESREIIREPLGRDTPKKPEKGPGARFARLLTRLSNRG